MRPLAVLIVCALLVSACGSAPDRRTTATTHRPAPERTTPPADAAAPAQQHDANTPLATLAGEVIMTKLDGTTATVAERAAVRNLDVGGIILFGSNVSDEAQLRSLLTSLRDARAAGVRGHDAPAHLLVSVDQEGGDIRNIPFALPAQSQPQLASTSPAQIERMTREEGRQLHELGIDLVLGPVADLDEGPNHTMRARSFGADPANASPRVAAYVRGLQAGGVAAVAKHFPGFGASSANSDDAIARIDIPRAELMERDLAPFRAAVDAGVSTIMVSHGIVRAVGSKRPAIVEPRVATTMLRRHLAFDGVAMTDSMNARGFRDAWGDTVPRACPAALNAGIDLLLLTGTLETAQLCRRRILEAVRSGALSEARLRDAAERVRRLRSRVSAAAPGA